MQSISSLFLSLSPLPSLTLLLFLILFFTLFRLVTVSSLMLSSFSSSHSCHHLFHQPFSSFFFYFLSLFLFLPIAHRTQLGARFTLFFSSINTTLIFILYAALLEKRVQDSRHERKYYRTSGRRRMDAQMKNEWTRRARREKTSHRIIE